MEAFLCARPLPFKRWFLLETYPSTNGRTYKPGILQLVTSQNSCISASTASVKMAENSATGASSSSGAGGQQCGRGAWTVGAYADTILNFSKPSNSTGVDLTRFSEIIRRFGFTPSEEPNHVLRCYQFMNVADSEHADDPWELQEFKFGNCKAFHECRPPSKAETLWSAPLPTRAPL
jgi:hypothetical protein